MVLISKEDEDEIVIHNFDCWDRDFGSRFISKMNKYGWTEEYTNSQIFCPINWSILRRKGARYRYDKELYNPYYEIMYKQYRVGTIEVDVGGWNTLYDWKVREELVDLIDNLPFDKIVNECILKFL